MPLVGKPPPGVGGGAGYVSQVIQVYADGWHETVTAVADTGHATGSGVIRRNVQQVIQPLNRKAVEIFSLAQEAPQRRGSGCSMERPAPLQHFLRLTDNRLSDCAIGAPEQTLSNDRTRPFAAVRGRPLSCFPTLADVPSILIPSRGGSDCGRCSA